MANPIGTLMEKIVGQPKCCVRNPPNGGPNARPRYVSVACIPSARPRSDDGNAATSSAGLSANSIAVPSACKARDAINNPMVRDRLHASEPSVKMTMPIR